MGTFETIRMGGERRKVNLSLVHPFPALYNNLVLVVLLLNVR